MPPIIICILYHTVAQELNNPEINIHKFHWWFILMVICEEVPNGEYRHIQLIHNFSPYKYISYSLVTCNLLIKLHSQFSPDDLAVISQAIPACEISVSHSYPINDISACILSTWIWFQWKKKLYHSFIN